MSRSCCPGGGLLYAIRPPYRSGEWQLRADGGPWPNINIWFYRRRLTPLWPAGRGGPPPGYALPPAPLVGTCRLWAGVRKTAAIVIPSLSGDWRLRADSGLCISINILLLPGENHSTLARRLGRTSCRFHAIPLPPPPILKVPGGEGSLYFEPNAGSYLL